MDEKQDSDVMEFDGVKFPPRKLKALMLYLMALEEAVLSDVGSRELFIFDWEWPELSKHISESR